MLENNINLIIAQSEYFPEENLIVTHISGDVEGADVEKWNYSLQEALAQVTDNENFKILINLHGCKAANLEAHKRFRTVIPATLARYGWKTGYVNLFEEAAEMKLTQTRGITCVAAAHVHQDETKIKKYESLFGKENEHFFTYPGPAESWIRSFPV